MGNLTSQSGKQPENCCGVNGICSHEVLRDGEAGSYSKVVPNKLMKKVITYYFFASPVYKLLNSFSLGFIFICFVIETYSFVNGNPKDPSELCGLFLQKPTCALSMHIIN